MDDSAAACCTLSAGALATGALCDEISVSIPMQRRGGARRRAASRPTQRWAASIAPQAREGRQEDSCQKSTVFKVLRLEEASLRRAARLTRTDAMSSALSPGPGADRPSTGGRARPPTPGGTGLKMPKKPVVMCAALRRECMKLRARSLASAALMAPTHVFDVF